MIVRKTTRFSKNGFVKRIQARYHFRCVASGLYARVYTNKAANYVYKVADDEESESYRAFVIAAMKRQDNPWFPRIYSATVYRPKHSDPYLVVKMEKLIDINQYHVVAQLSESLHVSTNKHLSKYDKRHLKELRGVLKYLYRKFNNDLHYQNIMMRESDNHPVIIDPVN